MENQMKFSLAVDFSLLETPLGAMMVKEGKGARILVIPTAAEDAPAVSLEKLIEDIKKIAGGADTEKLNKALQDAVNSANEENKEDSGAEAIDLNKVTFTLKMLYLYIDTTKEETITEYAVNVLINTEGLIPAALKSLVDVKNVGVAVWNTNRRNVLDRMAIVSVNDYLGIGTGG